MCGRFTLRKPLTVLAKQIRFNLETTFADAVHQQPGARTRHRHAPDAIHDDAADWVYLRFLPQREVVERIHRAGKRVFLAGPLVAGNERDNWAKAVELRIDAILTDYPLELRQQLRSATRSLP